MWTKPITQITGRWCKWMPRSWHAAKKMNCAKIIGTPSAQGHLTKLTLSLFFFMAVKKKRRAIKAPLGSCLCANSITVGLKGGCSSTVFPLCLASCFPHGGGWFVLLMTPSCYDLIQFVLSNWWHTDILGCRRRGSHCKHFSPTNKVLLLMINGNEGEVCVCVSVTERKRRRKKMM